MTDTTKVLLALFAMALAALLVWHAKLASVDCANIIFWALALAIMEKPISAGVGALTVTAAAKLEQAKRGTA